MQAAGKVEERVGNFTGARDLYGASLFIEPTAPTLVAYALLELKRPSAASLAPTNDKSNNDNANQTAATTNYNYVKGLFEEALLLDPRHGPTYNAYGTAELRHGTAKGARQIFERGVKANCADAASIYHGYAKMELVLGNVDAARAMLRKGLQEAQLNDVGMDSQHRERAVFLSHTLGTMELNSNRPSEALEVFTAGIERYGNSSQLLLGAALCGAKLGKPEFAARLFERSVLADSKHAQAWQAWGVMEMRAGHIRSARKLFDCGLKTSPRHGALWHAYGKIFPLVVSFMLFSASLTTAYFRPGSYYGSACRRDRESQKVSEVRVSIIGLFDFVPVALRPAPLLSSLFLSGVRKAPRHVPLYQGWASLELRADNVVTAKRLLAKALTLNKHNGAGWLIAATIEKRLGNDGLVGLILRRGIECAPTDAELYRALGEHLLHKGDIGNVSTCSCFCLCC